MAPHLPGPVRRIGLALFRRLPPAIRRRAVHAGTPNFTVGAVLILRDDDGRLLLVRQRHARGWALPGGLLGHDETPEAALLREIAEELGVRFTTEEIAPATPHALVDPASRRVDVVFTSTSRVEVTPDGVEVLDARWFSPADLPTCTRGTRRLLIRCGVLPT